jgi:hypothetical protein
LRFAVHGVRLPLVDRVGVVWSDKENRIARAIDDQGK